MIDHLRNVLAALAGMVLALALLYLGARVISRAWWRTRREYYDDLKKRRNHGDTDQT